ncbi:MAG: FkbM family methyltransferase [Pirellulaceae bacterium]|nr:FkbM family methyltransferase [Pirellulaceae bacterium]
MYISPAARLQYWKPNIYRLERSLFDAASLLVRPGDTVWDVGANAGVFAVAAAGKAGSSGRVMAFEADVWLVNLVARTARSLNSNYAPIDVVNIAMADKLGFSEFAIASRSRAANYLIKAGGSTQAGGIRATYRVLTFSPDELLSITDAPQVVKMDIESAEMIAFSSGARLLNEVRPRIICEVNARNREAIAKLFQASDYVLFDADGLAGGARRLDVASLNTLFIPSDDPLIAEIEKA